MAWEFLLLQNHCTCAIDRAPVCCSEGWRLIFAGSRFCTDAEQRYAPIEAEAAAISWELEVLRVHTMYKVFALRIFDTV